MTFAYWVAFIPEDRRKVKKNGPNGTIFWVSGVVATSHSGFVYRTGGCGSLLGSVLIEGGLDFLVDAAFLGVKVLSALFLVGEELVAGLLGPEFG